MSYQDHLDKECQARKQLGDSTPQRYCGFCGMPLDRIENR